MKTKLFKTVILFSTALMLFACGSKTEQKSKFVLAGTLEDVQEANLIFRGSSKADTIKVTNGTFTITGDYPTTRRVSLIFTNDTVRKYLQFFVENTTMTLTGKATELEKAVIKGSKVQDDYSIYTAMMMPLQEKYQSQMNEFFKLGAHITDEQREEMKKISSKYVANGNKIIDLYIKENPSSYYAAEISVSKIRGKSAKESEAILNALPEEMQSNILVIEARKKIETMKTVEVGIDEAMKDASNVTYKVDNKFNGSALTSVKYMGLLSNNNICALTTSGDIITFDANGKTVSKFTPSIDGKASSIAIDEKDQVYILSSIMKEVTQKVRGKVHTKMVADGVKCTITSTKGDVISTFNLADVKIATGARVIDNHLIVADYKSARIAMFNATTGEAGPIIEKNASLLWNS